MSVQRTLILECGFDRVSLAIFNCAGLQLKLQQLAVECFPIAEATGRSDDAVWLENVAATLRRLRWKAKYRGPATLILPAHLCLIKFIQVPRVESSQQEKILRFEVGQNIPHALADVVWGSVAVAESAHETDMLLAAAKLDMLDALCDDATRAGFEIRTVLPAPCATVAAFKSDAGNSGEGFLGINVGTRSTTLVLVDSLRFALRTFAVGPRDNDKTHEAMPEESFADRLHQEISRSLLHFQWRNGMSKPARVCVGGSAEAVPGLIDALEAKLKLPVEICTGRGVTGRCGTRPQTETGGHAPAAALIDLCGAAAVYFDPRHAQVNLLPPRMRERAGYRRRRPWLAVAALLALATLIPPLVHFASVREEAVKKADAIERELAPFRARDSRVKRNLRQIADIRKRIAYYQTIETRRGAWLRFLAGLQTRLGDVEDVWLEQLQPLPPLANAPMKLAISGRMLDRSHPLAKASPETFSRVSALLSQLAHAPSITAVEGERFDNRQPGVLQFDFVLVIDVRQPL